MILSSSTTTTLPPLPCRLAAVMVGVIALATGCEQVHVADVPMPIPSAAVEDEHLRRELDEVLEFTFRNRLLNTEDHAAWQILHGALAYGREFPVRQGREGATVSAVDHIFNGGLMSGWDVEPGDVLDPATGRRGLRATLDLGTKSGQGHPDQWLAILAQCSLPAEQTIRVGQQTYTMADYVAQAQRDVSRNVQREWSWTLIGLTAYLPTNTTWIAADGTSWSISQLVELEVEQDLASGACGGTHRLIGLTMALNHHLDQGNAIDGPWEEANELIQQSIQVARQFQNPDSSFSTNYFTRPGLSPDLADAIRTTGHTLEFLALAMTDEQLREPWVCRAALRLCEIFRTTKDMPVECGALYHAAHGLVLYRHRLFGQRSYAGAAEPNDSALP